MAFTMRKLMAGAVAVALLASTGVAFAQGDAIAQRKEGFKQTRANLGAIKKVIDDNAAPAGAVAPAKGIIAHAERIPSLFPKGSDAGETAAKPDIWSDWAGFEMAAKNLGAAATKVAAAGEAGDAAALKVAFGELGGTCAACHNKFRK